MVILHPSLPSFSSLLFLIHLSLSLHSHRLLFCSKCPAHPPLLFFSFFPPLNVSRFPPHWEKVKWQKPIFETYNCPRGWLEWSVWKVELGSVPRHTWLCHRQLLARGTVAHALGTQRMTSCYLSPVEILLCASTEAEHGGTESGERMNLFKEAEFWISECDKVKDWRTRKR